MSPSADEFISGDEISVKKPLGNQPLNNPALFTYSGLQSGLYSWGNTLITNSYKTDYINANKEITTLDAGGRNAANGKIGVLEIGGSNPGIMFNGLRSAQLDDAGFGSKITFVNAGLNAVDLSNILHSDADYWKTVQTLLSKNDLTSLQVEVIFCIEDNLKNPDQTINRATSLKNDYVALLDLVRTKFPNCKLFLVGDRGYTGYSSDPRHKEPIGYLNGWGVKLFVEEYADGNLPEYPFVNWLDYYWANGATPRWDGLTYLKSDYRGGYLHFTDEKAQELGVSTHQKLKADVGTMNWYK